MRVLKCLLAITLALVLAPAASGQSRLPVGQDVARPGVEELPQAYSDAAPRLGLAELEGLALENHPALARAAAEVRAARGRWLQAGLYPNPIGGYTGSEMGNEGQAGQQGAFIQQEFVTGGKLRLDRAVAAQEVGRLQHQFEAQRYRVLTDVRTRFYEALAAERTLRIAEQLADVGRQGLETAQALFQAEDVSRADVLQAQIELDSTRIVASNAGNSYQAAWRRLAAAAGAPGMAPVPLAGDLEEGLPEIGWHEALDRLLAESPELAAARARVARSRWTIERALAQPVPNIEVQASAQHDNATHDDIASVQIGLPIPIFNRNQGAVRQAQAELTAARAEVRRLELALEARLATAYERYANARQQVVLYSGSILPNARENLDLVAEGYRLGEFNYMTLLTAQRTFFQTNLSYLTSLVELRRSEAAIQGLLPSGSLESSAAND